MNRGRFLALVAVCLPLSCVIPFFLPSTGPEDMLHQFAVGAVCGIPGGLAGGSIALLLRKRYVTYHAGTRTLRGPSRWRNNTDYPRAGYDRLEYSPYDGRIYEVRADGRKRRLFPRRWVADPRDWKVLVDLLLDANATTPESPRSDRTADGAD